MTKVLKPAPSGKGDPSAPLDDGLAVFVKLMAQGPCLCAEIAPKDRPCLTCEAKATLRRPLHRARRRP